MRNWFVVPSLLVCALVCSVHPSTRAEEAVGLNENLINAGSKDSPLRPHPHQQVSSWSSSPFSQWKWFNSVLSLRDDNDSEDSTDSRMVGRPQLPPHSLPSANHADAEEEDDSTLSLVLLLDDTEQEENKSSSSSKDSSSHSSSSSTTSTKDSGNLVPPILPPFVKRSKPCSSQNQSRCRRGQVSTIPANQVRQGWEDDYSSVPDVLIQFSQKQAEETICNDLSVQLFRVDLREHYLEPVWVREIVHLGMCPSKLQTRNFGKDVWPSSIVETKCLCHDQKCSNLGGDFRCQAVRRPIRTWVRHLEKFMLVQEMVTVGCVCVQRTSPEGKYVNAAIES